MIIIHYYLFKFVISLLLFKNYPYEILTDKRMIEACFKFDLHMYRKGMDRYNCT